MTQEQKNRILREAQKDSYNGKEYEHKIYDRSVLLSELVMLVVGLSLMIVEYLKKHTYNLGIVAIILIAISVQMLYEGIKIKKVWKIALGTFLLVFAIIVIIGYVGQVAA